MERLIAITSKAWQFANGNALVTFRREVLFPGKCIGESVPGHFEK